MHALDKRFEDLGYSLRESAAPAAIYKPAVIVGNLAYCSGAVPVTGGKLRFHGKVGRDISLEDARQSAALCAANNLRQVYSVVGSLRRIAQVVRLTGFVNSDPDFIDQHLVINGASELLRAVFGDAGVGARSAVGMASLPLGAATETELIVALHPA